jgi:hypothetical protein
MRGWRIWAGSCVLALVLSGGASRAEVEAPAPAVEPRAVELVTEMARTLAALKAARVSTEYTVDVVLVGGQKLQYGGATTAVWQREPGRLRSERAGEKGSTVLTYDGKELTLYVTPQKFYATRPAPPTLDALLDHALERFDLAPPGLDLLYSDGGLALLDDVQSGIYVGATTIAGRHCHHVAFRAPDVDWQLWIEDGARPLPCRYLITTLDVERTPEMGVTFGEWDTSPDLSDALFTFAPPEGARPIAIEEPADAPMGATVEGTE